MNDFIEIPRSSDGLLLFAESCLQMETVYMFGAFGEILTSSKILRQKTLYPDSFPIERVRYLLHRCNGHCRAFDCSGLLKRYLMGGFEKYSYSSEFDLNCESLFAVSPKKGDIDSMPEEPGLCTFMNGHTGVYAGNGTVIEATPNPQFGNGIVRTKLADRQWTNWFELPWIEYNHESKD